MINIIIKYVLKEKVISIIKEYVAKGERCMNQSNDNNEQDLYKFWDGFHNCAENILREIKNIK